MPKSFPYSKLSLSSKCFCTLRYYRPILIFYFFLHLDGTSHESAEPSRGDVNSAGHLQTVGPLLASALVLLASLSSLQHPASLKYTGRLVIEHFQETLRSFCPLKSSFSHRKMLLWRYNWKVFNEQKPHPTKNPLNCDTHTKIGPCPFGAPM